MDEDGQPIPGCAAQRRRDRNVVPAACSEGRNHRHLSACFRRRQRNLSPRSLARKTPSVAAHLDIQNLKLSVVDGLFLKVTFETAGPVLPEGDAGVSGIAYRVYFDAHKPSAPSGRCCERRRCLDNSRLCAAEPRERRQITILCVRSRRLAPREDERQHHFDSGNPAAGAPWRETDCRFCRCHCFRLGRASCADSRSPGRS